MAILALIPMGMTLNSGTLIGLLLSIGRLVDDSIIDIHAVEREMKLGKDPVRATVDGITQVRTAVMASTFMLCLALAPLLFSGGIVQLMFGNWSGRSYSDCWPRWWFPSRLLPDVRETPAPAP